MLNMLVALMNQTYQRVAANVENEVLVERMPP
jgi:hypothetical protein